MNKLPVADIVIPEDRQRREFGDIEDLASSIARVGLINPITVDGTTLIAGHRRLLACQHLGWEEVPVREFADLSEMDRTLIELEENVKRKNLTWQEEADAIAKFHTLRKAELSAEAQEQEDLEPGSSENWTLNHTAKSLGISPSYVSRAITVRENIADPKVQAATSISQAHSILNRRRLRARENNLAKLLSDDTEVPLEKVAIEADFQEWAKTYSGPKFSFIHCDFPYGINHVSSDQGNNAIWQSYEDDSPELFQGLLHALLSNQERLCHESTHCMFWLSLKYRSFVEDAFAKAGWKLVCPFPLIWHKTDNRGIIADAQRQPRNIGEYALIFSRGDRKLVEPRASIYGAPTQKRYHLSEKPVSVMRQFLKMFIDAETEVLDPTCGSGSALRVAAELKANLIVGLDISKENVELTNELLDTDKKLRITSPILESSDDGQD